MPHARALLAFLAALVAAVLPLGAPAAQADGDLVVTWPAVTELNPTQTDYTIHIEDSGPGTLFVAWQWSMGGVPQEVPQSGDVAVNLARDGVDQVEVRRCADGACQVVARSPLLHVYRGIAMEYFGDGPFTIGPHGMALTVKFQPGTGPVDVAWSVTSLDSPGGPVLASGEYQRPAGRKVDLPYYAPAGLVERERLQLTFDYRMETETYGILQHRDLLEMRYDSTVWGKVTTSRTTIYPMRDGLGDQVLVGFDNDEDLYNATLGVYDSAGNRVARFPQEEPAWDDPYMWEWNGRSQGRLLPEGRYAARLTARDMAGNPVASTKWLTLSHKRVHWKLFDRTYPAASTLVDQYVERCSRLQRPSSHGGRGSLGLYSLAKCGDRAAGVVSTIHGVYLPSARDGRFKSVQVTYLGGKAEGARDAYVQWFSYDSHGDYLGRQQQGGFWGTHSPTPLPSHAIADRRTRPHVYWGLGLTEGSRYDVQSFRVRVRYWTFS